MSLTTESTSTMLHEFETRRISPTSFFLMLLLDKTYAAHARALSQHSSTILNVLYDNASDDVLTWATRLVGNTYSKEILVLTQKESGLQFRASTATAERISEFRLNDIAGSMHQIAPQLWELLDVLFSADKHANRRRI